MPFDFAIPFHMMVAMIGGLLAIVHASCHIADYFHAVRLWADSSATASHMSCIQCAADSCTRPDKDIVSWFVWCRRVSQQTCGLQFIQRHRTRSRSGTSCTTIQQAQVSAVRREHVCACCTASRSPPVLHPCTREVRAEPNVTQPAPTHHCACARRGDDAHGAEYGVFVRTTIPQEGGISEGHGSRQSAEQLRLVPIRPPLFAPSP